MKTVEEPCFEIVDRGGGNGPGEPDAWIEGDGIIMIQRAKRVPPAREKVPEKLPPVLAEKALVQLGWEPVAWNAALEMKWAILGWREAGGG